MGWRPRLDPESAQAPTSTCNSSPHPALLSDPVHGLSHWDVVQVNGAECPRQACSQGLATPAGNNTPQIPSFQGALGWGRNRQTTLA